MFRSLLSPAAVLLAIHTWAQTPARITQENGDCLGAIFLTDTIHVQVKAPRGFGNVLEVKENPPEHKQWLEREHHSIWYRFRAPWRSTLTFDILPNDPADDIDFLLFKGAVPGLCDKVITRAVAPVRTNISRNDRAIGSRCGLSATAKEAFVRSGAGASFSSAIEVEQGELFYLLVDYSDRPRAGFTLHLHYGAPPPPPPTVAEKPVRKQVVDVMVQDATTGAPVEAAVTVEGPVFDAVLEGRGAAEHRFVGDPYRDIKVGCVAPGYLFGSSLVKGSGGDSVRIAIKLQPIQEGSRVVLDDIRFVGNDSKVLRNSSSALLLLLRFMQVNPEVHILIEGHVNGPTFKNSKEFIHLSEARAMTVYNFLLVNDVDPARVGYVGMGNAHMLFPDPKDQKENEANRRVEIKVLGRPAAPTGPQLGKAGR